MVYISIHRIMRLTAGIFPESKYLDFNLLSSWKEGNDNNMYRNGINKGMYSNLYMYNNMGYRVAHHRMRQVSSTAGQKMRREIITTI